MTSATPTGTNTLIRDAATHQAIHRSAEVDARSVSITVSGSTVALEGVVGSWVELEAAESAVMHALGVTRVHNRSSVEPQLVPLPLQADELS